MKQNIGKRLASLVLALVLVAGMMPMMSLTAHAAYSTGISPFDVEIYAKHDCGSDCGINKSDRESYSTDGATRTYKLKVSWQCLQCQGLVKDTSFSDIVVTCNDCEQGTPDTTVTKTVGEVTATFVFSRAAEQHGASYIKTIPATCTATGEKKVTNCFYCGLTKTLETFPIDPNNHKAASEWSREDGHHYKVCDNGCGTQLEKAACTYSDATCTEPSACSVCKYVYAVKLGHSYTYTADGSVLTEKCSNGCGHSASVALVRDEGVSTAYTGSQITPYIAQETGTTVAEYTVSYENNVVPGTATVTLTMGDATITRNFEITLGSFGSNAVKGYTGAYDGQAHGINLEGLPAGSTVEYKDSAAGEYSATPVKRTDVGTTRVWYKLTNPNYVDKEGT